ncbi:MAG: SufD family Fe-S cluster assembly protein [Bacilli bacterium]|nr:SufD family Fe-S cluster assembly protein [Bacilli bacterium]
MNKLLIGDINTSKTLYLEEDTTLIIEKYKGYLSIVAKNDIQVFINVLFSDIRIKYSTVHNTRVYVFAIDSSVSFDIDLLKDDILFNYYYSNINIKDNDYNININHLGNNITSKITNHGINTTDSKLSYVINTVVPKNYTRINTNQDSKIITLKDNNSTIKPNLLIDNDDIEANHSAYIGRFKEDNIFYLMTRGISRDDATVLLVRSFLIGGMDISFEEREIILKQINEYWR